MIRSTSMLAMLMLASASAALHAQDAEGRAAASATRTDSAVMPVAHTGDRVRLQVRGAAQAWMTGRLLQMDGDSLQMEVRFHRRMVARQDVERLEVAHGRDRAAGALRGGGLGMVALVIPVAVARCSGIGCGMRGGAAGLAALAGIAGGSLVGALQGVQRWQPARLPDTERTASIGGGAREGGSVRLDDPASPLATTCTGTGIASTGCAAGRTR
jgi:hypothetical protein